VSAPEFACPGCGAELSVEQLFAQSVEHRAFMHLAAISIPLGARVLSYVGLFAPARNRLSIARKVRLIEQLLPDLQRQAITHNGRDWDVPLAAWSLAIDGMLAQRDKLRLPLSGHGYLYAVLQGMADKVERGDEQQTERDRRSQRGGQAGADIDAAPAEQQGRPARPVFKSAADVLAANPHLRKGTTHE
jgi:hypothetical protein